MFNFCVILCIFITFNCLNADRSPYAGRRPTGYKDRLVQNADVTTTAPGIGDRIGGVAADNNANINNNINNQMVGSAGVTTARVPYDALGDIEGYNYYSQLPKEQQPFWVLNYQAIEAHRNTGTVTAPLTPSLNAPASNQGVANVANRFSGDGGGGAADPVNVKPKENQSLYDIVYPIPQQQSSVGQLTSTAQIPSTT